MTEIRPEAPARKGLTPKQLEDDLRALSKSSGEQIPDLGHSVIAVRSRRRTTAQRLGDTLMPITNTLTRRPWLTTAAVAATAVLVFTVVPISYERTTGADVALTVAGVRDMSQARNIANEMKHVLGASQILVKTEASDAGATLTLESFVPGSSGVNAAARANALAKELNARGYSASAVATPHHEKVSGNVYAFARDLVIHVDTDGKSSAQIEAEIRQRLAENGVTNTQVSVTDSGNQRKVMIEARRTSDDQSVEPPMVSLDLQKNGQSTPQGEGVSVRVQKMKSEDGVTMNLKVASKGREVSVVVPRVDTMSDAALGAEITSQLKAAGLDVAVRVTNGEIAIEQKP